MKNENHNVDVVPDLYKTKDGVFIPIGGARTKNDSIGQVFSERSEIRRREILTLIQQSTNLATEIRNIALANEHSKLRLIVPPEMYERLEDGSWGLREAKDGSGLLPIAVESKNGQFAKQVRLKWASDDLNARTFMANMAAHAKTHALLEQVLAKLDVIDTKLELVLKNQRAGWQGKIKTGIKTIERVRDGKQPLNHTSHTRLSSAEQSIREGYYEGIKILENTLSDLSQSALPQKRHIGQSVFDLFFSSKPSDVLAEKLDELRGDVEFLAAGVHALMAITILLEGEDSAQKELSDFAQDITKIVDKYTPLIRSATYDHNRQRFWMQQVSALEYKPTAGCLVIEFEAKECLEIAYQNSNCGE